MFLELVDLLQLLELFVGQGDALEIHQDVLYGDILAFAPGELVVGSLHKLPVEVLVLLVELDLSAVYSIQEILKISQC